MQIELEEGEAALVLKADGSPEVVMPRAKDKTDDEPVSASAAIAFMLAVKLCDQKFVDDLFNNLEDMIAIQNALDQVNPNKE